MGGLILTALHIPLFVALTYWQGTREKIYSDFFLFKRKYGKLYDTFSNFDTAFINGLDQTLDKEDHNSGMDEDQDPELMEEIDPDLHPFRNYDLPYPMSDQVH